MFVFIHVGPALLFQQLSVCHSMRKLLQDRVAMLHLWVKYKRELATLKYLVHIRIPQSGRFKGFCGWNEERSVCNKYKGVCVCVCVRVRVLKHTVFRKWKHLPHQICIFIRVWNNIWASMAELNPRPHSVAHSARIMLHSKTFKSNKQSAYGTSVNKRTNQLHVWAINDVCFVVAVTRVGLYLDMCVCMYIYLPTYLPANYVPIIFCCRQCNILSEWLGIKCVTSQKYFFHNNENRSCCFRTSWHGQMLNMENR